MGILPLYHIYGMTVLMCYALTRRAELVLLHKFEPQPFLDAMSRFQVSMPTYAFGTWVQWVATYGLDQGEITDHQEFSFVAGCRRAANLILRQSQAPIEI